MNDLTEIFGIAAVMRRLDEMSDKLDRLEQRIAPREDDLWDVKEAARHLRHTEDTIRKWAREGRIPIAQRKGKKMLFNPADLVETRG